MEKALFAETRTAVQGIDKIHSRKRGSEKRVDVSDLIGRSGSTRSVVDVLHGLLPLLFPDVSMESEHILFPANKKHHQEQYLEVILTALDKPSHVQRILQEWTVRFPEYPMTEVGIRSIAIRQKNTFITIGRTSTYGLRRWELDRPDIKGGTIRSIIKDHLERSDVPLPIGQLVQHVRLYRPKTKLSSVRLNLKLDGSGRFLLLPDGRVGLTSKHYAANPDPTENRARDMTSNAKSSDAEPLIPDK